MNTFYISKLSSDEYGVVSFEKYNADTIVDFESNIRALKIKKCVLNKNESLGDCFKNVLSLQKRELSIAGVHFEH